MKSVRIIGGGFAGLVTAWALLKRGFTVEIYEAKNQLGGMIQTRNHSGQTYDIAANGLLNSAVIEELINDLQLDLNRPVGAAKRRYIYRNGLRRWPISWSGTIRLIWGLIKGKMQNKLQPKVDESLSDWGDRVLGLEARTYLLSPAVQGIYASEANELSASLLLSRFFINSSQVKKSKSAKGSLFPRQGMVQVIEALKNYLSQRGVTFHMNKPITDLDPNQRTVVATNAPSAALILQSTYPEIAQRLKKVKLLSLATVEVFAENTLVAGFGVLFPIDSGFKSIGMLQDSVLFPWRHTKPTERWILGGTRQPDLYRLSDETLIQQVQADRKKLGAKDYPSAILIDRWDQALPLYSLEHAEIIENLKLPSNLALNGNYLGGIGLSQIAAHAVEIADRWCDRD